MLALPKQAQQAPTEEGSPDLLADARAGSADLLQDQSLQDLDLPPELPASFTPGRMMGTPRPAAPAIPGSRACCS
jgi:hypothetical protein